MCLIFLIVQAGDYILLEDSYGTSLDLIIILNTDSRRGARGVVKRIVLRWVNYASWGKNELIIFLYLLDSLNHITKVSTRTIMMGGKSVIWEVIYGGFILESLNSPRNSHEA